MAALTVYATNTASSTLSTAETLITASGGSTSAQQVTSKVNTATQWGEVVSQGTTNAWAATSSQGSPTGNGWLFDVTTLEGKTFNIGTWTWNFNMGWSDAVHAVTADIRVRFYKRSSGGVYTLIDTATQTSQSITFATKAFTASTSNTASMTFSTGDKLYVDLWCNITTNNSTTANVGWVKPLSNTSGWTGADVVTPGYFVQNTKSTVFRSVIRTLKTVSTGFRSPIRTLVTKSSGLRSVIRSTTTTSAVFRVPIRTLVSKSIGLRALIGGSPHSLSLALRSRIANTLARSTSIRSILYTPSTRSAKIRIIARTIIDYCNLRTIVANTHEISSILRIRVRSTNTNSASNRVVVRSKAIQTLLYRVLVGTPRSYSVPMFIHTSGTSNQNLGIRVVAIAPPPPSNISFLIREGNATFNTRDGEAYFTVRPVSL